MSTVAAQEMAVAALKYRKAVRRWSGLLGDGMMFGGDDEDNPRCERAYQKTVKAERELLDAVLNFRKAARAALTRGKATGSTQPPSLNAITQPG